jgi:hypothetical protein
MCSDLPSRSGLKDPNLPDHNRPLNGLATEHALSLRKLRDNITENTNLLGKNDRLLFITYR